MLDKRYMIKFYTKCCLTCLHRLLPPTTKLPPPPPILPAYRASLCYSVIDLLLLPL